jgi:hypothetical protein
MAGLENDRQAEYVRILQIALEDAWRAALNLDDPNQRKILVYELATAKAYAAQLKPAPTNDTASKAAPEIGAIESTGDHKGEIYGGIYPADNKPIWFSVAPRLMDHYEAAAWAEGQRSSLPTRKQGDYLTTLKGKLEICPAKPDGGGALTELFNRGNSFPAGYVWLAEPVTYLNKVASCQRLSDGDQIYSMLDIELPFLCVKR